MAGKLATIKKAVVATLSVAGTSLASLAAALADYPVLAGVLIAAGTVVGGWVTWLVKNATFVDEAVGYGDSYLNR